MIVTALALGGGLSRARAQSPSGPSTTSEPLLVDGDPLVKSWSPPVYPEELKAQKVTGDVSVQLVIDETGTLQDVRVAKSSDPRFNDAVLAAVKAATYQPAIVQSKPVAAGVGLTWHFRLPYNPPKTTLPQDSQLRALPVKPAKTQSTPNPDYPDSAGNRHLDGEVDLDVEVGTDGAVSNFKILFASDADFVLPAVEAVRSWKFEPAHQGELAVKDHKAVPLTFNYESRVGGDTRSTLQANGFELQIPEGKTAKDICSKEPIVVVVPEPVYPLDLLTAPGAGEAEVEFTLNSSGLPENVTVKSASQPSCGSALAYAVEASIFKPAVLDGQAVAVKMTKKHQFAPPATEAKSDESDEMRLLRTLKAGETIPGPKGLDAKLIPLWRTMPVYPQSLRANPTKGVAEVEFVIDRTGRARVPRVVSATSDEFGWSAATAIAQWVFEAPKRGGQPVDVRVKIPVQFSPPKS